MHSFFVFNLFQKKKTNLIEKFNIFFLMIIKNDANTYLLASTCVLNATYVSFN